MKGRLFMLQTQEQMRLSTYQNLYDIVVPKDNILRKMKELVDFSFVQEELSKNYCLNNGRNAVSPIRMFKYLVLKAMYELSDGDVVERSRYDMSFKYFLDMTPEDPVIEASSLTKFRKLRLKDVGMLDLLIGKTVEIALENDLLKSHTIIVDSTHTKARYNQKSPREALSELAKNLRKAVYQADASMKEKMPKKSNTGILEDEIDYCRELIRIVEKEEKLSINQNVKEKLNYLEETVEDNLEKLELSKDTDAKTGHKTYDTAFFGYKTHLAMSEERIITAAVVTSGEKHDGKQLKELVEKSEKTGFKVEEIIGDAAYSERENIEYAKEEEIKLISKLSRTVSHGPKRKNGEFEYNKDAGMYVCPQGHMSIRKSSNRPRKYKEEAAGTVETYFFDVEKCKHCPRRKGCYREGAKTKSYSVTIRSDIHTEHQKFQETDYFKERARERYKIEAKNSELKNRHGYDVASSSGLVGMELQGAVTIFAANLKRILRLMAEK